MHRRIYSAVSTVSFVVVVLAAISFDAVGSSMKPIIGTIAAISAAVSIVFYFINRFCGEEARASETDSNTESLSLSHGIHDVASTGSAATTSSGGLGVLYLRSQQHQQIWGIRMYPTAVYPLRTMQQLKMQSQVERHRSEKFVNETVEIIQRLATGEGGDQFDFRIDRSGCHIVYRSPSTDYKRRSSSSVTQPTIREFDLTAFGSLSGKPN